MPRKRASPCATAPRRAEAPRYTPVTWLGGGLPPLPTGFPLTRLCWEGPEPELTERLIQELFSLIIDGNRHLNVLPV